MKVWIDLSNSPHPLLFAPIGRRLEELGHEVVVTARDNAQTLELAHERWPVVSTIGGRSPEQRSAKAAALVQRIRDLRSWARSAKPDVALSHNSYAQIVAAFSLGLPIVTAMDYEHQPANHVAFRLADRILLPEALPPHAVRRQGASPRKVRRYPGLKEEIYLGDFQPDPEILASLGIEREPGTTIVLMRAPPEGAMYHQFRNPVYESLLSSITGRRDVRCILLARHPDQRAALERRKLANCVVPRRAIDSRSLLYASDVFIGAGGTMTREAALMGVRTLSIYAGAPPAIEEWLEREGLLSRLTSPDLGDLGARERERPDPAALRSRGEALIGFFVAETERAAS